MTRTSRTIFMVALLSSGLSLAQPRQDTASRLVGSVMDTAGAGLPATTVWVAPNSLTQVEMNQIEAAGKAVESAEVRLRAEQPSLFGARLFSASSSTSKRMSRKQRSRGLTWSWLPH
jgi:hypothetical protein